jgi:serine/threonine protein kinase
VTDKGVKGWPNNVATEFDGLSVLRLINDASVATAFLARETKPERLVALKVLRMEFATDAAMCARFEKEAIAVAPIAHRNVAAIYRVGKRDDGLPYFVQEYIGGRSLADVLRDPEVRAADDSLRTIASLAKALAAAHANGIVHSHVRPENILVEQDSGRIVLTNFGIVGQVPRADTASHFSRYTSPEQNRDEPSTASSDMFSFGVLANELLGDRAPDELVQLLRKCTDNDAHERPTANELVLHLSRDEHIEAPKDLMQPTQRAGELVMMRAAVVGGIVIMAIGAAVAYWLYEHYTQEPSNSTDTQIYEEVSDN